VIGPIAAAVTAGRLLNLSGEQMSWAIGLSCSMSGGLMSFMADGAWSKWMHAGWAAKSGIAAAELAAKNFVGPERVFERDQGLYRSFLFGEDIDMAGVVDGLGEVWQGSRAEFKYFPSAHVIQPYVESLLSIVIENDLRAEQIQSIDCGLPSWAAGVVAEPREARLKFSSELEAIASLYFQLASAVLDRNVNLKSLQKTQRGRPELLSLAERISHHSVPSSTSTLEGDLTLSTSSGAKHRSRIKVSPPDKTRIEEKFKTNLSIATPSVREHKIELLTQAMLSASLPNWRHAGQLVSYFRWPA
jgi:2-methylcitrate dehydratase PrpD